MALKLAFAMVPIALGGRTQVEPLGQVLALMDELAAKVTKEGVVEQAAFEEYFAWCDDLNKNSHFAINTAITQKEKLQAKIGELSADIQAGESKIADLASAISTATAQLEKATDFLEMENAGFVSSEEELAATADTVGRANHP